MACVGQFLSNSGCFSTVVRNFLVTKILAEPLVGEVYTLHLSTVLGLKSQQNEKQ